MRHMRTSMAAAALALAAGWASAQEDGPAKAPPDARKSFVEGRTEQVLAPPVPQRGDLRKLAIEGGTEEALRAAAPANPKVAPGLVRWHADLAAAQAAARASGKPVLVFQLLGNLDDEFC